jgi:hypothetical protein
VKNWIKLGAISSLLSITALADHGGNKNKGDNSNGNGLFGSSVVGSVPSTTISGVVSGGAPWTVARGEVSISGRGKLEVEVHGLLLTTGAPANRVGTVGGPVRMVAGSLVCGGSGGAVAGSTARRAHEPRWRCRD